MERYNVKIDSFEGPLDLLLHLVKQSEMDIYHISVAEITNQYLKYVRTMQELELNIASEYLVMAATLLEIKSKMLLPPVEEEETPENEEEEDIQDQLLARLIEYRKYKEAADHLRNREETNNRYYAKDPEEFEENDTVISQKVTLFDMLDAYHALHNRYVHEEENVQAIPTDEITIENSMELIMGQLAVHKRPIQLFDFFKSMDRTQTVTTFLAILELMKDRKVACRQVGNFGEITVQLRQEENVI